VAGSSTDGDMQPCKLVRLEDRPTVRGRIMAAVCADPADQNPEPIPRKVGWSTRTLATEL